MAKFIGLHSLPGFTREMLQKGSQDSAETYGIQVLKVHGDGSTGRVICEVEAPDRESFIAWLNKINMPYDEICKVDLQMDLAEETESTSKRTDLKGKIVSWLNR